GRAAARDGVVAPAALLVARHDRRGDRQYRLRHCDLRPGARPHGARRGLARDLGPGPRPDRAGAPWRAPPRPPPRGRLRGPQRPDPDERPAPVLVSACSHHMVVLSAAKDLADRPKLLLKR